MPNRFIFSGLSIVLMPYFQQKWGQRLFSPARPAPGIGRQLSDKEIFDFVYEYVIAAGPAALRTFANIVYDSIVLTFAEIFLPVLYCGYEVTVLSQDDVLSSLHMRLCA
jgi:hypothetical protein